MQDLSLGFVATAEQVERQVEIALLYLDFPTYYLSSRLNHLFACLIEKLLA